MHVHNKKVTESRNTGQIANIFFYYLQYCVHSLPSKLHVLLIEVLPTWPREVDVNALNETFYLFGKWKWARICFEILLLG
jgi:hypothetical protein